MTEHISEYDVVVLTRDLPEDELYAGDVGVVLALHEGGSSTPSGVTIEITSVTGDTVAVVDVPIADARPAAVSDVRHVRTIQRIA